jgi:hypothetical protein
MTASLTGGASRPPARATARDAVVPFGPADVGSSARSGSRAPALVPTTATTATTAPTAPTATTASPWQPGRSTRPGLSSRPNLSLEDPPR